MYAETAVDDSKMYETNKRFRKFRADYFNPSDVSRSGQPTDADGSKTVPLALTESYQHRTTPWSKKFLGSTTQQYRGNYIDFEG